jgi:AraC-like DNA-binding protein
LLALLFLILAYEFFVNLIFITGYLVLFPHFFGTALPLVLLFGPLLFFYIKIHITDNFYFKAKYLWHFLPYLAVNIIYLPFFMMKGSDKVTEFQGLIDGRPSLLLSIVLLLTSLMPLLYAVWSLIVIKKHRDKISNLYSFTTEKMKLDWLWYLTWSMLIVSIIAFILNSIIAFSDMADWLQLRHYVLTISVLWVFSLGYYGIRRTPFFQDFPLLTEVDEARAVLEDLNRKKYEKTRIHEDAYEQYKKILLDHMEEKKPYLNQKLTIAQVAKQIDMPAHHLSQLLNEYLNQTFYEFINSYRIEEVKERYKDPANRNLTLIGIAMESGFSSKSSFNRIFKQFTGKTPSEYFKLMEESMVS